MWPENKIYNGLWYKWSDDEVKSGKSDTNDLHRFGIGE